MDVKRFQVGIVSPIISSRRWLMHSEKVRRIGQVTFTARSQSEFEFSAIFKLNFSLKLYGAGPERDFPVHSLRTQFLVAIATEMFCK